MNEKQEAETFYKLYLKAFSLVVSGTPITMSMYQVKHYGDTPLSEKEIAAFTLGAADGREALKYGEASMNKPAQLIRSKSDVLAVLQERAG